MDIIVNTLVMLSRGISGVFVAGLALLLMLIALVRKEPGLMLIAAIFAIPATYISGSWAGLLLIVRLFPLFLLGSAYSISHDDAVFAWFLPMPVLGFLIYYIFRLVMAGFVGA